MNVAAVTIFVHFLVVLFFLPLNIVVLIAIYKKRKQWDTWTFRLLFQIGILDLISMIPGIPRMLQVVFQRPGTSVFNKVIYFCTLVFPNVQTQFCMLLAIYRMTVIVELRFLQISGLYAVASLFPWLTCVGLFTAATYAKLDVSYSFIVNHNVYELNYPSNISHVRAVELYELEKLLELLIGCAYFGVALTCYAVTIAYITVKKGAKRVSLQELCLFLQAILPFVWSLINLLTPLLESPQIPDSVLIIRAFVGQYRCGVHATVYIIFNRTIRNEVLKILQMKKKTNAIKSTLTRDSRV